MEWLITYLLAAQAAWIPVRATATESVEAAEVRRVRIAAAVVEVAYDPAETPLFGGDDGRAKTAVFLDAIASYEGGYHVRVDAGQMQGDGGRSWCQMQLNVGPGHTPEGWSGPELAADYGRCFRAALHVLQHSAATCGSYGRRGSDLYAIYTAGRCAVGSHAAAARYDRARHYVAAHPLPEAASAVAGVTLATSDR